MNLIDRYVLFAFLRTLMWALLAFLTVFVLIDLVDHIDNFIDDNASLVEIFKYYLYLLPQFVDLVLPISVLMASMFSVGMLSKNRESTAMLSAGISTARATRSLLVAGVVIAGLSLAWGELVVAESNRRLRDVQEYEIKGREREALHGRSDFTHVDESGRVYVVSRFRPRPPTLDRVSVQTFTDSTLVERIDARRAVWEGGRWQLREGTVRSFDEGGVENVVPFVEMELDGPAEPPANFSRQRIEPAEMNYRELRNFADWVDRTGGNSTRYRADMAHKLSFPVINFLVVLLGASIGSARRRANLWAGFGLTVALAFGYYILMNFGLEFGRSGKLGVHTAAWLGNVVYAIAGGVLFWRANR